MRTTTWSWSSFMGWPPVSSGVASALSAAIPRERRPGINTPRDVQEDEIERRLPHGGAERRGCGRSSERRYFPAGVGDEGGEQAHHDGEGGGHQIARAQVEHGRSRHDDDEPRRGERGQARSYPEQPWEDQAEAAQSFAHADEAQEQPRYRDGAGHLVEGKDQLHAAREQKEGAEQDLDDPQQYVHVGLP